MIIIIITTLVIIIILTTTSIIIITAKLGTLQLIQLPRMAPVIVLHLAVPLCRTAQMCNLQCANLQGAIFANFQGAMCANLQGVMCICENGECTELCSMQMCNVHYANLECVLCTVHHMCTVHCANVTRILQYLMCVGYHIGTVHVHIRNARCPVCSEHCVQWSRMIKYTLQSALHSCRVEWTRLSNLYCSLMYNLPCALCNMCSAFLCCVPRFNHCSVPHRRLGLQYCTTTCSAVLLGCSVLLTVGKPCQLLQCAPHSGIGLFHSV